MTKTGMFWLALVAVPALAGHAQTPAAPASEPPAAYHTACAGCHGATLQDGRAPALKSAAIAAQTPEALFAKIKGTMPLKAPGSLSDTDYQAITDYIVAQNGTVTAH